MAEYENAWNRRDNDGRPVEALRVTIHDRSVRSSTNPAPEFGPNDTGAAMLAPIEKDIAAKRAMLEEHNGFDPVTGRPNYRIAEGSRRREAIEFELSALEGHTLPLTKLRAEAADAYHASRPTQAQKLQAEIDRRNAREARARELADEAEAQQMANRLLKQRGLGIG